MSGKGGNRDESNREGGHCRIRCGQCTGRLLCQIGQGDAWMMNSIYQGLAGLRAVSPLTFLLAFRGWHS